MSEAMKVSETISGYVMQNPCMFVNAGPLILSDHINIRKMAADLVDARTALTLATQRAEAAEAATKRAEHGIEVALNEHEACKVLLFRIEELKAELDALRKDAAGLTHFVIPAEAGLDPVRVILIDHEPSKGTIIVQCYNEAWTAYFGATGDRTLVQFIASADREYLGGALGGRNVKYCARIANAVILACRERLSAATPVRS